MPAPPDSGEVIWAKRREELRGYGPAEAAVDLRNLPVWREVVATRCDQADETAGRAKKAVYSSEELELLLFLKASCGRKSMEGDDGLIAYLQHPKRQKDLELLGFAQPRDIPAGLLAKRSDWVQDGLPRGARFTQHEARLCLGDRLQFWKQIYGSARAAELSFTPTEELLVLYMDSTHAETIYTCPIFDPKTGKVVNEAAVKCWDGGRLPSDSHDPNAQGFKVTFVWTSHGMPLGFNDGAITESCSTLAIPLIHEVGPLLKARVVGHPQIGIMVMDSGFHTPYELRAAIRSYGFAESCSETSSVNEARARAEDARWIPFRHRPEWGTNGHREPNCECGGAKPTRRFDTLADGSLRPRIELRCPKHGYFAVTSGEYLLADGRRDWVRADPTHTTKDGKPEALSADLRLGNSLTYNDHLHIAYSEKRWGHNEGVHGALTKSKLLFDGKNRFRRRAELQITVYQVLTYLHLRGIKCRTRSSASLPLAA